MSTPLCLPEIGLRKAVTQFIGVEDDVGEYPIGPPGLEEGFDLLHGPDVVYMISSRIQ